MFPQSPNFTPNKNHLDSLGRILNLLTLAHRRNKNQHRISKWWKEFNMLLRHIRKLILEMDLLLAWLPSAETGVEEMRVWLEHRLRDRGMKEGMEERQKRKKAKGRVVRRQVEELLRKIIGERVLFLGKMMGKFYFSFSTLTADTKFAQLGLFLLGNLARLRKVLVDLGLQGEDMETSAQDQQPKGLSSGRDLAIPQESLEISAGLFHSGVRVDLGERVNRDEGSWNEEMVEPDAEERGSHLQESPSKDMSAKSKKRKRKGDAFDDIFNALR